MLGIRIFSKIAVYPITGSIGMSVDARETVEVLERLENISKLKAVVLPVNSTGGLPGSSEMIYRAIKRLAAIKPVVVSFQDNGASGAYELACPATAIVALETSLIGSIGVITRKITLKKLYETAGIEMEYIKSGKHKDMFSAHRKLTAEEVRKLRDISNEVYDVFINRVAEHRKLELDAVRELATGEVFTGNRAKELGLVDYIGDLYDAILIASKLSGVPEHRQVHVTPKRHWLRRMIEPAIEESVDVVFEKLDSDMALWR